MELQEFISLDQASRIDKVWEKGKFWGLRMDNDMNHYYLFRMDEFYVESHKRDNKRGLQNIEPVSKDYIMSNYPDVRDFILGV